MNNSLALLVATLGSLCLLLQAGLAQDSGTQQVNLDELIDWKDMLSTPHAQFLSKMQEIEKRCSLSCRREGKELDVSYFFDPRAPRIEYGVFGELLRPSWAYFQWKSGELNYIRIAFDATQGRPGIDPLATLATLDKYFGIPHSVIQGDNFVWNHDGYRARFFKFSNADGHCIQFERASTKTDTPSNSPQSTTESAKALSANLDAFLNVATIWNTSPDAFEQLYTAKAADPKAQQKPPQFEWMNAEKSRARFSRQMFSNVETKLTMFAGSIKVEEAILEFVNGKAAKSTISFYNRGDSGDIEVKDFDRIFKTIGQSLGQVLKVAPKRQLNSTNAALPVAGWMWTSPQATALLEYNEYQVPGKVIKPEFLRLRLAAPGQTDYTMGKMVTGVQSMELVKRVTKKPDGEVYISGVPMVDQGQKGYCVAASCQRLFEYMRIPCDQHEMAQLVQVDADSGANVFGMQKSLAKIDGRFKVSFKPLVNPEQYYSGSSGKRRVSDKEFNSIVKEYVNKGVPLLWALELGRADEEPPLPGAGQTRGGHMRMIIGYKMENNQITKILFTDSWGSGHELKRMAAYDAYDVTIGLYSMAPRGL
jgi:hypothetical protein